MGFCADGSTYFDDFDRLGNGVSLEFAFCGVLNVHDSVLLSSNIMIKFKLLCGKLMTLKFKMWHI